MKFGEYELERRLGVGGMAQVWVARRADGRHVVIKRVLPHLAESEMFIQLFLREGHVSTRLLHANIVRVFELGQVDGEYFLAMEYVDGLPLGAFMRAHLRRHRKPTSLALTAHVIADVARALAYAHSLRDERRNLMRVIHRDVSPSNVMLGYDGTAKLLDFGIAKVVAGSCQMSLSAMRGKLGYIAPEILDGGRIDHRADIFSLGVLLHEMLTGRRLFKGTTDFNTIALMQSASVPPPSQDNPEVPAELDEACLRAVARDPAARTRDAAQIALTLDDLSRAHGWDRSSLVRELAATRT